MDYNKRDKNPNETNAQVIVRMFPSDANPAGNVFGGEILKHIDMVAGIVAQRHSQSNAVTVSMDSVSFLKPVYVGNVLKFDARMNYVHKSSMEIEVKVESENIESGDKTIAAKAFVTFVSLGKDGKPESVPKLLLITDDDRKKFEEGKQRMEQRIRNRKNK